jgi:hypothetical protein
MRLSPFVLVTASAVVSAATTSSGVSGSVLSGLAGLTGATGETTASTGSQPGLIGSTGSTGSTGPAGSTYSTAGDSSSSSDVTAESVAYPYYGTSLGGSSYVGGYTGGATYASTVPNYGWTYAATSGLSATTYQQCIETASSCSPGTGSKS